MKQTFAEFLKAELKRREIAESDLPRRTGLKPGVVSYLLSGKRAPDEKTLEALAEGLDLPLEYLRQRAGYEVRTPSLSLAKERLDRRNHIWKRGRGAGIAGHARPLLHPV